MNDQHPHSSVACAVLSTPPTLVEQQRAGSNRYKGWMTQLSQDIDSGNGVRAALENREQPYFSGVSPEAQSIHRLISEIAPTEIPIVLEGESGTGKEIAALEIHALSRHRDEPFIKLSCSTLTQESFQTQLRALEQGREDLRVTAGSLFFNEISELDANCQRQLLHALPDGNGLQAHQALGGRVISCTTRDLKSEVQNGNFRSELFYRLNGVCLRLPPLRRRTQDIAPLAEHFLDKYGKIYNRGRMHLSEPTLQLFLQYGWPGNIRELENVVKKIAALGSEEMAVSDLRSRPSEYRAPEIMAAARSLKATSRAASQQAERQLILQTLEQTHWNRKRAAEALQISYKALLYKLKQIQVPGSDES